MKHQAPETTHIEKEGSIIEFDDGKHARPLLGVVGEVAAKKKKSNDIVYVVMDAKENSHRVSSKHIHCSFPADDKLKASAPTKEKLQDYSAVSKLYPIDLGIDLDLIQMAWEALADEGELSIEAIMSEIDPDLCKTPAGKYRAFRLLSSEIGQLFFKRLHGHDSQHLEFMPKSAKKVQGSKEKWCKEAEWQVDWDGARAQDLCLV
jgi:hypothetical protein